MIDQKSGDIEFRSISGDWGELWVPNTHSRVKKFAASLKYSRKNAAIVGELRRRLEETYSDRASTQELFCLLN